MAKLDRPELHLASCDAVGANHESSVSHQSWCVFLLCFVFGIACFVCSNANRVIVSLHT